MAFGDGATGDGFGLAQVRERLDTTYENRASIEMAANGAVGTRVRITIACDA